MAQNAKQKGFGSRTRGDYYPQTIQTSRAWRVRADQALVDVSASFLEEKPRRAG